MVKSTHVPGRAPGRTTLSERVFTELDRENDGSAHLGPSNRPRHWSKAFGEYGRIHSSNERVDHQPPVTPTRNIAPGAAILRRHLQLKGSMEELILDLYYSNMSVATAEESMRLMWGAEAINAPIGEYARKIVWRIEAWLQREIIESQSYVFLQSISVKQKIAGETRATDIFAAVGVTIEGAREVLAILTSNHPEGDPWHQLLSELKRRGLRGTELFVGTNDPALLAAVSEHFPQARYQGNLDQVERDILWRVPLTDVHFVTSAFAQMRSSDALPTAAGHAEELVGALRRTGQSDAARLLEWTIPFQFSYYHFPKAHWTRLRDGEPLKRILREFRSWIRIGGPVADDKVLMLMVAARLRHTARHSWSSRRFFSH